jgi:YggT family protein
MGRPWWYDSYWEKGEKPRRTRGPRGWVLVWVFIALLSLFLTANGTGFRPVLVPWIISFVSWFCRLLSLLVFSRTVLSWFSFSPYNRPVMLLRDATNPVLAPLRNVIPPIGAIDITPLVAIVVLNLIPVMVNGFVSLVVP